MSPRLLATGLLAAAAFALPLCAAAADPAPRQRASAPQAKPTDKKAKAAAAKTSAAKRKPAAAAAAKKVSHPSPAPRETYAGRPEAMRFAQEVAERRGLDAAWTRRALSEARPLAIVQRLMQPAPPGTRKNWAAYRSRFIDRVRIEGGLRFWQENRAALQKAEAEYGVPAEMIVGIIGVETLYGRHMGDFRVIDALATLAFDHPPQHPRAAERAEYFRGELEQFLSTQHRRGLDPLEPLGSFAGAQGLPQFMPTSWVRWAVDFDGDGRVDLRNSAADAIGSVASYFKGHGWQTGMPTHYPVSFDADHLDLDALLAPDILPTFNVASFAAKGAVLDGAAQGHAGPLALVELQNGEGLPTYVAGTENFYVVTRYNQSSYYAMAVIELGRAVAEQLGR
ncbi:lytic murein transglycosylase B [Ramlibacter rhizophilus]|uniref:Lytic murein transglycosylase B n=2 Tax=Ramlibacter rhizophilus TaxID=1781167 RepID=A0A4Z0BCM7_9BURK|nr:lytic murein transglycosylase B [Ramlibacter rhizophilus]